MEIDDMSFYPTLVALAAEDGVTLEDMLGRLVKREDEERHVDWDRKSRDWERFRCRRPMCRESAPPRPQVTILMSQK